MAAVGFTWCVSGLAVDRNSYVFIVGYLFSSLPFALLFHMLSSFPTGRLDGRFARSVAALGYFVTTVLWWTILLFYDTTRDDWASNPIMAFDDQGTADTLLAIQSVLALGLTIAVPFVLRQRWLSAGRPMRQVLAPVYITASVLMLLLLTTLIADLSGLSDEVEVVIDVAGLVTPRGDPVRLPGRSAAQPAVARGRGERAGGPPVGARRPAQRAPRRSGRRPRGPGAHAPLLAAGARAVRERRGPAGGAARPAPGTGWPRSWRTTGRRWRRSCTTRR